MCGQRLAGGDEGGDVVFEGSQPANGAALGDLEAVGAAAAGLGLVDQGVAEIGFEDGQLLAPGGDFTVEVFAFGVGDTGVGVGRLGGRGGRPCT